MSEPLSDHDLAVQARVVALMRQIIAGDATIEPVGETWDDAYAANVEFACSTGDRITFFNDCDGLDYVDSVRLVDGAGFQGQYASLPALDVLTHTEQRALELILKSAVKR